MKGFLQSDIFPEFPRLQDLYVYNKVKLDAQEFTIFESNIMH